MADNVPQPLSKKILVTEDEKALARALELKLKSAGFLVQIASNGEEALQALTQGTFDLILLDLAMPIMDGFTVLNELKSRSIAIPVIVASNLGQPEDLERAKELGAKDYFIKANTSLDDIVGKIKIALL